MQKPVIPEDAVIAIVAYKRSWREVLRPEFEFFIKKEKSSKKKERFGMGSLWKLTQPVEID